ncbi:hypothetical protein JA9_004065 [Meyerozyma sp. JA9]|nr:hypothetical protein JA9_004065 [Meyerozyma sp. JA9]
MTKPFSSNGAFFMLAPVFLITSDYVVSRFTGATAATGLKKTKQGRKQQRIGKIKQTQEDESEDG